MTASLIKFSLAIPLGVIEPAGEFQSQEAAAQMGRTLESAGVAACYVTDHPAPVATWLHANGHDATDPFTSLSFVAAATSSLRLHTNVVVLPYRNPFITAKAAAILQVFSGGRLILGVGAGYQQGEFEALGVDFTKRDVLTDEALETIRLAWSGGPVVKQGRNFNALGNEPRPVPKPHPTLWVGGGSDRAVERAAKWADGWSPFFTAPTLSPNNRALAIQSLEQLAEKIRVLTDLRAKIGKSGAVRRLHRSPSPHQGHGPAGSRALHRSSRTAYADRRELDYHRSAPSQSHGVPGGRALVRRRGRETVLADADQLTDFLPIRQVRRDLQRDSP